MSVDVEVIKYGIKNFRRNLRNYVLSSIIVITTLTAILLMLGINDLERYNISKTLYNIGDEVNYYYFMPSEEKVTHNEQKFLHDLETLEDVIVVEEYSLVNKSVKYSSDKDIVYNTTFINPTLLDYFYVQDSYYFPEVLSGKPNFSEKNNVVIDEVTSLILFGTKHSVGKVIEVDFVNNETSSSEVYELEIVGVITSTVERLANVEENDALVLQLYLGYELLESNFFQKLSEQLLVKYHIYTKHEKIVDSYALKNSIILGESLWKEQLRLRNIRINQIENQFYSLLAIFIVICANIYASIKIIINARKKEIGIQRAIGASKWQIVQQYLSEYSLFYFFSCLFAIILYAVIILAYIFYHRLLGEYYEYYLSQYSVGIFLCIVGAMNVISSLIILISVDVKIIDSIKSE